MKKIIDECCSCDLPCLGNTCPMRNKVAYFCDKCESEVGVDIDFLYDFCGECVLELLDKVKTD